MTGRAVLVPFRRLEAAEVSTCAAVANVSTETIRRWCDQYGIGRKMGGRYLVSRPAFAMHLEGDEEALQAYLAGDRASPAIRRYFDKTNCLPALK